MTTLFVDRVADGMDVYDSADDKIGTVEEVYESGSGEASASGGGYLRVPTGFLGMGKEHHIPFSAISDIRDNTIYLSVASDRLDELGYDQAPIERGAGEGRNEARTVERPTTSMTTDHPRISGDDARRTLQLREEELIARKRSVEAGAVNLRTEVVSEQRSLEVPVTHEEVIVERHAVDQRPSDRPIGESETISVPVHAEQVQVDKQTVVYEEVSVGTRAVQETEHLSESVRREEAVVDKIGDVEIDGGTTVTDRARP